MHKELLRVSLRRYYIVMGESVSRLLVFAAVSGLFGLSVNLFFGSILAGGGGDEINKIVVKDEFSPAEELHTFSGTVLVPSTCHDLTVRVHDFDADTLILVFESWERPHFLSCKKRDDLTPKSFRAVAFAPGWVEVKALFDGRFVPFRLITSTSEDK